jgi:DNA-binding beta-propeller fold protein YncE
VIGLRRRQGKRHLHSAALGFALLWAAAGSGCRATWTPVTLAPPAPLQWPFAPAPARVTYSHALAGLARDAGVASVLQAVAFGRSGNDDRFVLPVAMASDREGRIAVADTGCRCVHLFSPADEAYRRLTGTEQQRLASPVGVAFADDGRLFVADSTGALFAFERSGELRFMRRESGELRWQRPTGLVWSTSRKLLYVVDTLAHSVRAVDAEGDLVFSFGSRGSEPGQLNFPTHVALAPDGEVFVTDALNFRIAIFDGDGRSTGVFGHHGDGSGDLAMPKGIAVDAAGVVYVVDALFDNVQLFDRRGAFLLTVGARGTGFGEFWLPSGAFLDGQGRFHVCDTYNRRIQVFRVENGHAIRPS